MQSCRTSLRLVLLASLALPALSGERAAASSPAPALPLPPAVFVPPLHPHPRSVPNRRIFARVAARTGVPLALLLAVSYVQSQWGNHGGRPTIDGGYGLMDLVHNPERDTLDAAARLLGMPPGRVAREDALNVLGGAQLLARAARARSPHHGLPRTLGGWAPAVVWLTGMHSRLATEALLREVYGLLAHGGAFRGRPARAIGPIGRWRAMPDAGPNVRTLAPLLPLPAAARGQGADYPGAIRAPSPNVTPARQPAKGRVSYVVIHDTEGSCAAALSWLDGPASGSSAHFLVCQDGTVYQLAHVRDIA
ncbi:MAG TPA: N-acetylmuramoyl-L-alanine amidase, partial [Chloroflexota bacterium]|nr:N-acetylmuramoyl-L-alanine amidase [Chloroflexota bacterium]